MRSRTRGRPSARPPGQPRPAVVRRRQRSARLIDILNLVNQALEAALQPERAAWAALVALTAGEGVGFNRAFVLITDEGRLQGWFGIGPRTVEEASAVWSDIRQRGVHPLERLGDAPDSALHAELARHSETLQRITQPWAESCASWRRPFVGRPRHPHPVVRHWLAALATDALAVLPMPAASGAWRAVIADNFVTHAPILPSSLHAAESIVHALRSALDRTTLLEQLQDEHRRRIVAEHATAMLETARALAHDLKNPLALAGGLARDLLAAPPPAESLTKRLATIATAVQQAEDRLARLGAELTTGVSRIAVTPLDIGEQVERVAQSFRVAAERRGMRLLVYRPVRELLGLADASLLERCVENLIGNALQSLRDARLPGGVVRIGVFASGDQVRVEIADNGPPLPGPLRGNPFAGGISTHRSGTGLGLVSVRRLMDAMGGGVEYDEREPGWVRFTLHLRRST